MITGAKNNKPRGNIILDDEIIYNLPTIKILGTLFSESAKFNENVQLGPNSFITGLKRRSNIIIRISKSYNINFRTQFINSILIGKIRYNLSTWGNINLNLKNKINKIILKTVDLSTQDHWIRKSVTWKMKMMKIDDYFTLFRKSCFKLTFNLLNSNGNAASILLSKDLSIRNISENKCGPTVDNSGWTYISQNFFIYQMRTLYNSLPRDLTLCQSRTTFKKWMDFFFTKTEFQRLPTSQK